MDRPLLAAWTSLEPVAAYELGARLVGPAGVLNSAVSVVLEPFVYRHALSEGTAAWIERYVRVYVATFATVSMAIAVAGPEVVRWLAPEPYWVASRVLPPLAFTLTCEGLQRAAGIGAELRKRTIVWASVSLVTLAA